MEPSPGPLGPNCQTWADRHFGLGPFRFWSLPKEKRNYLLPSPLSSLAAHCAQRTTEREHRGTSHFPSGHRHAYDPIFTSYTTTTTQPPSSAQSPTENGGSSGRSGALAAPPVVLEEAVQKIDFNPPKGTRDFPPEEMRLRNWLFNNCREVSRLYGFEEVDFPVLESEALFIRKAGEEIRDQLYCFEDHGNRRVALRPELTPSLARLVIQKLVSLPLKWSAVGQCWRYERMTRGRRRERYQWNMDIVGVPEVTRIGITASDVGFKVSSRKEVLRCYSISENLFGKVCIIIDKRYLEEQGKQLLILNNFSHSLKGLVIRSGFSLMHQLSVALPTTLGFDREGKLRAICDGGRYDHLLSTFGGDDIPACGFGFGDAVIVELLKEKGIIPELSVQVENIVCALDHDLQGAAAKVATLLRDKGQSVDLVLENKPLKWVFKRAARINAQRLILVGNTEWQKGMVGVKILSTGEQYEVKLDELD
ncbi:histidine--tRNA ligase, chloroplastic/mitochondrial isoform X3 [Hevea brasiliensis]|uniref:histidine--tRNA ligase, chloroplastic/mitochondrial isoform X3 n=1 Tax=Hevea brasiliensis TaxID=3981 RepID=UPI0025DFEB93|nr:histidine--tRNA ligase, chloroplastic/mitochondrial isoform X3 [Hevea brasiliensis]